MLFGAINYNNSLGYMLTFLLAGLAVISILHTYRNMAGLRFRAGRSTPVFAGGWALFELLLDNPTGAAHFVISLRPDKGQQGSVTDVIGGVPTAVQLGLVAARRGRLELGRVTVSSTHPLGLFRAWAYVELGMRCLVYPRPAPRTGTPPLSPRRLSDQGDQGRGADDFVGFRTYHPGDSPRHVHWKAAARGQGLITKQFGGDRVEELWLDWKLVEGLDTEARLRQLCRWVLDAHALGHSYGLRLPGLELAPARGQQQRQRCLEALALFGIEA